MCLCQHQCQPIQGPPTRLEILKKNKFWTKCTTCWPFNVLNYIFVSFSIENGFWDVEVQILNYEDCKSVIQQSSKQFSDIKNDMICANQINEYAERLQEYEILVSNNY